MNNGIFGRLDVPIVSTEAMTNLKEVRYIIHTKGLEVREDDYREDRYYDSYRIREHVKDGKTIYQKIENKQAGMSTKVKIDLSKREFVKEIKKVPLLHIRMDAIRPIVDDVEMFMERVTVINSNLIFYSTEYEYNEKFAHINPKTYSDQLSKVPGVISVESYGETPLARLSFLMLSKYI